MAGTIIWFLLEISAGVTPGIFYFSIRIVKRFRQISGFKCNNDVKTLSGA